MKVIKGGITAPLGFLANGVYCGIKPRGKNARDVALIYSTNTCVASAVFTSNKVQAAPIKISKAHIKNGKAQAIIANSGCANCCTGKSGLAHAEETAELTARALMLSEYDVLVASTGKIGRALNIKAIKKGIPLLVKGLSKNGSSRAARAIMTTDTRPKQSSISLTIGNKKVSIGAIAKGSGMIFPDMATMFCFIATDAVVSIAALDAALKTAIDNSFNKITVDGDRSTNDCVFILANGLAGNRRILPGRKDFAKFTQALQFITERLAKEIVLDGEGATKFIQVEVYGAKTLSEAKKAAQAVANSALVKTAISGSMPNWGRIAAAVGSSGVHLNHDKLDIYLENIRVMKNGSARLHSKSLLQILFKKKDINIKINLNAGRHNFKIWTSDLSEDYVRINKGL